MEMQGKKDGKKNWKTNEQNNIKRDRWQMRRRGEEQTLKKTYSILFKSCFYITVGPAKRSINKADRVYLSGCVTWYLTGIKNYIMPFGTSQTNKKYEDYRTIFYHERLEKQNHIITQQYLWFSYFTIHFWVQQHRLDNEPKEGWTVGRLHRRND